MKEVRLNKRTITYSKTLAGEMGIPDQNLINPCSKECARQVKNLDLNGHPDKKWQATLPVTLSAAPLLHPIPPNSIQPRMLSSCGSSGALGAGEEAARPPPS